DHDEELDQVVVHRARGRLHDEAVDSAYVFADLDVALAVGELGYLGSARGNFDVPADRFRELAIRAAAKDGERLDHGKSSRRSTRYPGVLSRSGCILAAG